MVLSDLISHVLDSRFHDLHHLTSFKSEPILEVALKSGHKTAATALRDAAASLDPVQKKWEARRAKDIALVRQEIQVLKKLKGKEVLLKGKLDKNYHEQLQVQQDIDEGEIKVTELRSLPARMKKQNKQLQEKMYDCDEMSRPLSKVLREEEHKVSALETEVTQNIRGVLQHKNDPESKRLADKVINELKSRVAPIKKRVKLEAMDKYNTTDEMTKLKLAKACKSRIESQIEANNEEAKPAADKIVETKERVSNEKHSKELLVKEKEQLKSTLDQVVRTEAKVEKKKMVDEARARNDEKQLSLIAGQKAEYAAEAKNYDAIAANDQRALMSRIKYRNQTPGELCITPSGERIYKEGPCVENGCVMQDGDCTVLKPIPKAFSGDEIEQLDNVKKTRSKCVQLSQRRAMHQYAMHHKDDLPDEYQHDYTRSGLKKINDEEIKCWEHEYSPQLEILLTTQKGVLKQMQDKIYGIDIRNQSRTGLHMHDLLQMARADSRQYAMKIQDALSEVMQQVPPGTSDTETQSHLEEQIQLGKEIFDDEMKAFRFLQDATTNESTLGYVKPTPAQVKEAMMWHSESKAKLRDLVSMTENCRRQEDGFISSAKSIVAGIWSSDDKPPCTALGDAAKELIAQKDSEMDDLGPYMHDSAEKMDPATNKVIVDSMDANSLEPRVRRTQGKLAFATIAVQNAKKALVEEANPPGVSSQSMALFFSLVLPPKPEIRVNRVNFL
eukprot:GEMP01011838.1.p1 GENE.GEMP01011838.1~~GEMP01011838.1.p1  ORF type:complete len:727 (+),score=188.93 GEMP01011838.1:258-2438(+)